MPTIWIRSIMKTINSENYFDYLTEGTRNKLRDVTTYFYLGLIIVGGLIFIFSRGWNNLLNASLLLTTGFMFVFIVVELIFVVFRSRTFNRNLWITYGLITLTLIPLNYLIFNEHQRYWSFVSGLIFMVPVVVVVIANWISNRFN